MALGLVDPLDKLYHRFVFGGIVLIELCILAAGIQSIHQDARLAVCFLGIVAVLLPLTEVARRGHLREIDPGWMEIRNGQLWIDHPALFKAPFAIPLDQIRVAAVDETPEADEVRDVIGMSEDVAFPFFGNQDGALGGRYRGAVWADELPFPVRRLGRRAERPNFLILFATPFVAPKVRRRADQGPRTGEALAGLAARLPVPEHAEAVFAANGIRGRLLEDDLAVASAITSGRMEAVDPSARTYREVELESTIHAGWLVAIAGGLAFPFLSLWALPMVDIAWRSGKRLHAIGIMAAAGATLTLALFAWMHPPVESAWRFYVGGAAAVVFPIWAVWRAATARVGSS